MAAVMNFLWQKCTVTGNRQPRRRSCHCYSPEIVVVHTLPERDFILVPSSSRGLLGLHFPRCHIDSSFFACPRLKVPSCNLRFSQYLLSQFLASLNNIHMLTQASPLTHSSLSVSTLLAEATCVPNYFSPQAPGSCLLDLEAASGGPYTSALPC